ncbi:MAG: hypothetical protein E7588_08990 [Ruminococcaceae bacterium]|nr:hypothetical protein [Oscillospiraceae bacterium]
MATFFNQATLSYSGGTVNSNVTSGEIIEVLSASKTAVTGEYTQGSEITYAINIANSGASPINGLTVTDNLGEYTAGALTLYPMDYINGSVKYFADGILQPAPAVIAGPPLVITGISIPANGVATILYTAVVNSTASPLADGTILNTAVISGAGITDITVNETVTSDNAPDLTIAKSVSPAVVTENGRITYTFVIQNTGNTPAVTTDNIVITDTFDPILSDISVTYNGTVLTEPDGYTYNPATGDFATQPGAVTVPGATYTQNPATGIWTVTPGVATLTVSGNI